MRALLAAAAASALLAGCHPRLHGPQPLRALEDEGELYVYLAPLADEAARLSFTVAGLSAAAPDGGALPLAVALREVSGPLARDQRLLAWGRLPPGNYGGLLLEASHATLASPEGASDLLVPTEPLRVDAGFAIGRGRATVLTLILRRPAPPEADFAFAPTFSSTERTPGNTQIETAAYCTNAGAASLTVLDRRRREVVAVIPTGAEPRGLALDARAARAYVALAGEDRVDVIDLQTGERVSRVPLRAGDAPREVALTPDGRTLLVANAGSNTVSFVDTEAALETDRVATGEEPWALLLDRDGRRAYAFDGRAGAITVIDVANRAAVTTVPTDAEPLRGQLSRDGTRLYVVHRGSGYLSVLAAPGLSLLARVHVGLGAAAVEVDPRTGRVYVGRGDEGRVQVVDPYALVPIDALEVPGPVSYLKVDELEGTLLALLAGHRVAVLDLASKRTLSVLDVGEGPYQIAVIGERR